MKILHAGNMVNAGYVIAKQLRKDGISVDLLMEKNPRPTSDPIHFDSSLQGKYPDWILFFDKKKWIWKYEVIKHMRNKKYDIIHAYVEFPIFANFTAIPFVAITQGSDFRELAFEKSLRGLLLRKAYKKARAILYMQPDHHPLFLKLKLKNGIFIPAPWDVEFFKHKKIGKNQYGEKFVIFHPTSLNWSLKGNDIFLKGFANFVKKNKNSILLITPNGVDRNRTDELISNLGISNYIDFIGPLSKQEMLNYYNICDVVADQFIIGSMGAVSLETMLCEKPLISFIDKNLHEKLYPKSPPIAIASNSEEVKNQLEKLQDIELRINLGKEGRKWVMENHSPEVISKKLQTIYESILNNESVEEIRNKVSKLKHNIK